MSLQQRHYYGGSYPAAPVAPYASPLPPTPSPVPFDTPTKDSRDFKKDYYYYGNLFILALLVGPQPVGQRVVLICALLCHAAEMALPSWYGPLQYSSLVVFVLALLWNWLLQTDDDETDSGWLVLEILFRAGCMSLWGVSAIGQTKPVPLVTAALVTNLVEWPGPPALVFTILHGILAHFIPVQSQILSLAPLALAPVLHLCSQPNIMAHGTEWILVCSLPVALGPLSPKIRTGAALVASLAVQQAYIIPFILESSYAHTGHASSYTLLSLYWILASIMAGGAGYIYAHPSLLGEYHDDAVQLSTAAVGLFAGKGCGLTWNFAPLPVLAFLGLGLWLSTRMLRYWFICVFVLHATSFVVTTYRFAGLHDTTVVWPWPMRTLSLTQFALVVTVASSLLGTVAGLAVRSGGGIGYTVLRKMDVTGLVLLSYTCLLFVLEVILIRWEGEVLYTVRLGFFTSGLLIVLTQYMRHVGMVKKLYAWLIMSMAAGKANALFLDRGQVDQGLELTATMTLSLGAVTAFTIMVCVAPHAFVQPMRLKVSSRYQSTLRGGSELPASSRTLLGIYGLVALPIGCLVTIFGVLAPMFDHFMGREFAMNATATISFAIGLFCTIWGASFLNMLNNYLPDGGGEFWKRVGALVCLIGLVVTAMTPSLNDQSSANMYSRMVLSYGARLAQRSQRRTGGLGLASAMLATLLSAAGPLRLKAKPSRSGRDTMVFFRTMMFGVLFGGGMAWFVASQLMTEEDMIPFLFSMLACMLMSFVGTVACVVTFSIDLGNFEEAEQTGNTFLGSMPILYLVAFFASTLGTSSNTQHLMGRISGDNAYLILSSLVAFCVGSAGRFRSNKDVRSRALANGFVIMSWFLANIAVLNRYGISSFDATTVGSTGVTYSSVGILVTSFILFMLEGGDFTKGSTRRVANTGGKSHFFLSMPLQSLQKSMIWLPIYVGAYIMLLSTSLYAILFRGSGVFTLFGLIGGSLNVQPSPTVDPFKLVGSEQMITLVQKAINSDDSLRTIANLAQAGFWTSDSFLTPILHLVGAASTVPTLHHLVTHWWMKGRITDNGLYTPTVPPKPLVALLNIVPLVLCQNVAGLQTAAWWGLLAGGLSLLVPPPQG